MVPNNNNKNTTNLVIVIFYFINTITNSFYKNIQTNQNQKIKHNYLQINFFELN